MDREEWRAVRGDSRVGTVGKGQRDACGCHQSPLESHQRANYPYVQRRENHFYQHREINIGG